MNEFTPIILGLASGFACRRLVSAARARTLFGIAACLLIALIAVTMTGEARASLFYLIPDYFLATVGYVFGTVARIPTRRSRTRMLAG